jgi:cytochrome c2
MFRLVIVMFNSKAAGSHRPMPIHSPISSCSCRLLTLVLIAITLSACSHPNAPENSGDRRRGQHLIYVYNCGSCHQIPGIAEATGTIGPTLEGFGNRLYVSGLLLNTPDNVARWLRDPQHVLPGTAMPNMGITSLQAMDITAYLYTLE